MSVDSYLLFVLASVLLCIAPGPDMIFLLSRTLAQGRKAGIMAAIGINAGAYVHLLAAILGISAVLAASAWAFTLVKWAGAAYLIYMGIQILRSKQGQLTIDGSQVKQENYRRIFWQGFWSDVLNPKVALFFLAFLPQFVAPEANQPVLQILLLGLTLNVVAICINITLVYLAHALTAKLRANQRINQWLNKAMGAVFILLGLNLAAKKI